MKNVLDLLCFLRMMEELLGVVAQKGETSRYSEMGKSLIDSVCIESGIDPEQALAMFNKSALGPEARQKFNDLNAWLKVRGYRQFHF